MERGTKEQENLRRDVNSILRDFEKNREWADFSNWLHRLLEIISPRHCPYLPQQLTLCKRLAQCLNPSLPAGVHSTALRVYETILHNIGQKTQLLPMIAMGLLPFFEHSNTQNKMTLLKIFDQHFISQVSGIQMIVGLMNALLTVFNENSQDFAKRVFAICDKVNRNFGRIWVDGAVWINILKSPKVRLAGFKYFTKVFRDRDKVVQIDKEPQQANQKQQIQKIEKMIEHSKLGQEEKVLLTSLFTYRDRPDDHSTRFPNFSSLVVNSLSVCLEVSTDNMIKRAALDLLGGYLKLNSGVFGHREGVVLLEKMLLLLVNKEYSLTNRVYKYLFDQPNSQGQFSIDLQKKQYELMILKQALSNLLTLRDNVESESVLLMMQTLVRDHPTLAEFLLGKLSIQIVTFAQRQQEQNKKQKMLVKSVSDFYLNVILMNRSHFISAILKKIPKKQQQINPIASSFEEVLNALQFYFGKMEKQMVQPKRKSSQDVTQTEKIDQAKESAEYLTIRVETLSQLIEYLWLNRPFEEQSCLKVLQLCNQMVAEVRIRCEAKKQGLSHQQLKKIQDLLEQEAKLKRKNIYAKLITLHPSPNKQILLPYIEDSSLSITCINLLLGGDRINNEALRPRAFSSGKKSRYRTDPKTSGDLSQQYQQPLQLSQSEQEEIFFAIFKLFNCHLFQISALQFIQRYRHWWSSLFVELIDRVQPSQWLIYWRKVEGEVSGGILRMLQNLNSNNSYYKHLSRKWITEAENIISKVLDAIFRLLNSNRKYSLEDEVKPEFVQFNIGDYQRIFNLIQLVFRSTSSGFSKFFFLQRDKYLTPFVLFVFKCLECDLFQRKSKALNMLVFLLSQTQAAEQKIDFLMLTFPNILATLDHIIDKKKCLEGDKALSRQETVLNSNFQIQLLEYISLGFRKIGGIKVKEDRIDQSIIHCMRMSGIYEILLKGVVFTDSDYIKNLYIQSSKQFSQMLARVDRGKVQITSFITKILDKLFILLKNSDVNRVEQIIKNRNEQGSKEVGIRRKGSIQMNQSFVSFSKQTVLETEVRENLNLEEKYAEIIQLWHTVKYYLEFAVRVQLKEMPIINLLSLMLTSFPLSYLKYTPAGSPDHTATLQNLEEEAGTVTGLKKEVFAIFQILWNKQSRQIVDFLVQKSDPRILIHSQLDPSKVLQALNKSSKLKQLARYLKGDRINLPKNMLHYNIDQLLKQNQILFFLYVYLLYCNLKLLKNKRINIFLQSLIDFLQLLKISPHVQTKLWLIEIVQLVGQRIISTKELNIEHGNRIKSQLQHITKDLIDEQVGIIEKSKNFTHKVQVKTGIFNIFSKQQKQESLYDFVKIFPPTIFNNYQNYQEIVKKGLEIKSQIISNMTEQDQKRMDLEHPRQRLSLYLMQLDNQTYHQENSLDKFLFHNFVNISESDYVEYLSLCSLKTLIRVGNSILINIYEKDVNKISLIIKEIIINLLSICENREPENQHANQLVAEYLHAVLNYDQLRPEILKHTRKNILEAYLASKFFKCTQRTLMHWKPVIDYCIGQNNDLLSELLSKQGLFEGIFTKKAEATRQKIKSLKRVCFIIYSGRVDRYQNKLRTVLQSLNQVMKQQQASPALLILILFCMRILLMRLSAISLNKLFKSVWPSLITLLIQIFRKDNKPKPCTLQLAALKVIELIHAMGLEEFMLHRWIFVFDYFGLKIDPMGQIEDNMHQCEMHSPFIFKPYLSTILPNNRLRCKFLPQPPQPSVNINRIVKRRLIVKKTFSQSDQQVKDVALLMMQYMMDLNEFRTQISKQEIQNLIEDQFVTLDDYIFKVK